MSMLSREPLSGADWFAVEYEPTTDEVVMLDQRLLPSEVTYHRYKKPDEVADAIRDMVVRGAPAIGISAAYALALPHRLAKSVFIRATCTLVSEPSRCPRRNNALCSAS